MIRIAIAAGLFAALSFGMSACSGGPQTDDPAMIMTCKVEGQVCGRGSGGTGCCGDLVCGRSGNYGTKVCRAP